MFSLHAAAATSNDGTSLAFDSALYWLVLAIQSRQAK
jgi:hypothetical protein